MSHNNPVGAVFEYRLDFRSPAGTLFRLYEDRCTGELRRQRGGIALEDSTPGAAF